MSVVNTNTKALLAQQAMTVSQRVMDQAAMQLSTGKRINSAADDAAGTAISVNMSSQAASLHQSIKNANDGISMLQTADGASQGVTDILHRMRELTVQYLNGTNDDGAKTYIDTEFGSLTSQMGQIITNTTWNGMTVLTMGGSKSFQVGSSSSDLVSVSFADFSSGSVAAAYTNFTLSGNADTALDTIDTAISAVGSARAVYGAAINRLNHSADHSANVAMNLHASRSRIEDTDYAQATADLAKAQILQNAGTAMLSQANQLPYMVLSLLR